LKSIVVITFIRVRVNPFLSASVPCRLAALPVQRIFIVDVVRIDVPSEFAQVAHMGFQQDTGAYFLGYPLCVARL
jgi:hypothetical protein